MFRNHDRGQELRRTLEAQSRVPRLRTIMLLLGVTILATAVGALLMRLMLAIAEHIF
ncbi:MAG: hypothetical protein OXG16_13045 [Rhodospirillales bacterium]|nr:hypothetical protein [Rhodospirillales bacterium]